MGEDTVAWPTASKFRVTQAVAKDSGSGYWYEARDFSQAEHSGTHTDAPAHFYKDRWHTADIPLNRLAAPAIKVDISVRALTDPDTELRVSDLEDWEAEHGVIPGRSIVVVHTGWGRLYSDRDRYLGRPEAARLPEDDVEHLHFPGVSPEAAEWLVNLREVVGVAIDTPSTDRGQSRTFSTHQVLGEANVWGLENLANSDQLPAKGFMIYNMVHKLEGGSGGPSRVVAVLNKVHAGNGASMKNKSFSFICISMIFNVLLS